MADKKKPVRRVKNAGGRKAASSKGRTVNAGGRKAPDRLNRMRDYAMPPSRGVRGGPSSTPTSGNERLGDPNRPAPPVHTLPYPRSGAPRPLPTPRPEPGMGPRAKIGPKEKQPVSPPATRPTRPWRSAPVALPVRPPMQGGPVPMPPGAVNLKGRSLKTPPTYKPPTR